MKEWPWWLGRPEKNTRIDLVGKTTRTNREILREEPRRHRCEFLYIATNGIRW
jgi:hypothetical protein